MRPLVKITSLRQPVARAHRLSQINKPRFSSSTSNSSLEITQKKVQEALAGAQKNAGNLWEGTKKLLEPAGQKFGQLLGSYKQPLLYNWSVAREVLKQIYLAESLQPPSIANIRSAYQTVRSRAGNMTYWRSIVQSGEIARVGVYGLEAYGIFKIGEMIGRQSLIGYHLH